MPRLELKTSIAPQILLGLLVAPLAAVCVRFAPIGVKLIALACLGLYIWWAIALAKRRVFVDEAGVTRKGVFGTTQLAWDEIDHYTFWSMGQTGMYAASGGGGAIGAVIIIAIVAAVRAAKKSGGNRQFSMGRMTLVARDGRTLALDTRYRKVGAALDVAFAELHPRLRAGTPDFSPFAVGPTDMLHAKKGTLGLADIDKVEATGGRLVVRKRGKRLAWASEHMKNVKNSMLLVELLAERGLVIKANHEVFMPQPVIEKLAAAASRQAALPQAKVVLRG